MGSHDHDGEVSARGKPAASPPAAAVAPKRPVTGSANARIPSRRVSDGMEEDRARAQTEAPATATAPPSASDEDDEEDSELLEQSDRRRKFTLKGASHSIKKVLAGKARGNKKETGVTRLDRKRIHLKSKSTPRAHAKPSGK